RPDRQPPVRIRHAGDDRRHSRDPDRCCRHRGDRWRREHDPRAVGDAQAGWSLSTRAPDGVRHRPRLAPGEPEDGGDVRHSDGAVTAGTPAPLTDGAPALVVMSESKARERNLQPLARCVASAPAGGHPDYMGIGPVPASMKALEKAGLQASDMGVVELNEAFAALSLACIRLLGLDEEKVNVNGGAIALGHPLGSSGARLVSTLVRELNHRDAEYGLATICIRLGQDIASIRQKI